MARSLARPLARLLRRTPQSWVDRRNREYDRMTVEIIRRTMRPHSNSVDAGAHEGLFLRHLVKAAPQGRHYAFEPIPELARRLIERYPSVQVHQVALADTNGEATFRYMPDDPAESSLYDRPDREAGHEVVPITVPMRRLDDVLPRDERIEFIKVDVEDAEIALLRGAEGILSRSRPVLVIECHVDRLAPVADILTEVGLELALLEDFLAGRSRSRGETIDLAVEHGEFYFAAGPPERPLTRAR
jgi:FkbM family methyltransferase